MSKLKITLPNGAVEEAELTTDVNLVGNDKLTVKIGNTNYYARLDTKQDTHCKITINNRSLWLQKNVDPPFSWSVTLGEMEDENLGIPKNGTYEVTYESIIGTFILEEGDTIEVVWLWEEDPAGKDGLTEVTIGEVIIYSTEKITSRYRKFTITYLHD